MKQLRVVIMVKDFEGKIKKYRWSDRFLAIAEASLYKTEAEFWQVLPDRTFQKLS